MSLIYGPLGGFFLIVSLAMLVVELWALIDAAIRPAPAYEAAGKQNKVFWIVILVLALFFRGLGLFGLIGLVAAIVYLVDVRPALREVSGGRGGGGGPYGGW